MKPVTRPIRISFRISENMGKLLIERAAALEWDMSEVIREALWAYLDPRSQSQKKK
jgi:hypothetical protein